MPGMLELPDLPVSVEIALRIVLIVVAALAAFFVLRTAVRISIGHLLERRGSEAGAGVLSQAELERRVHTIGNLVVRVAGVVIGVIAVLMALQLFGIDIGPAVAGLGVVGIAVGLGAQSLVRDVLAGIFVVLENQYSAGDVVRIADVEGVVADFTLRRTILRDVDGTLHSVPNGQILVSSNMTRVWARVNLDITVAAGTDADRASEAIARAGDDLKADPEWGSRVLGPPGVIRVEAPSQGWVTLEVLAQVRASERWTVGEELRGRIVAALGGAGIEVRDPDQVAVRRGGAEADARRA
jgi:small-conductance mechanosensitive channel